MALHLYVMQTEHGLIKIGRSSDPERRLLELRQRYHAHIALVLVLSERGDDEEMIHIALSQYQASPWSNEWFSGSKACRQAVSSVLEIAGIEWPYLVDRASATCWLKEFGNTQAHNSVMSSRRRTLRILKGAELGIGALHGMTGGHHFLDARIWTEIDGRPVLIGDGAAYYDDFSGNALKEIMVPRFTSIFEIAWSLWDDKELGADWLEESGQRSNPITCCAAALGARWGIDFTRLKPQGGF